MTTTRMTEDETLLRDLIVAEISKGVSKETVERYIETAILELSIYENTVVLKIRDQYTRDWFGRRFRRSIEHVVRTKCGAANVELEVVK